MTIALWSVLIAGLMPYAVVGIAKAGGGYDNRDPRAWATGLTGLRQRAHAAQLNSFEAFPLFAVAVLLAEMKGVPARMLTPLALGWLAMRGLYLWAYLTDRATLRSLIWVIALVLAVAIFTSPGWAV
jgi:uncharacterized MAPEG superfamily protein